MRGLVNLLLSVSSPKHFQAYYLSLMIVSFLVCFDGISGVLCRAMVRILAIRNEAKIPMARPYEPYMPPGT